jgi:hypothetical protein
MAKILMMVNDEEQPIRIGKMKVKQLKKALKKIQEIINLVQDGEGTSELIEYFMSMDKGAGAVDTALEDKMFIENVLGSFNILFNKVPDELTELIAIVSGVDEDIIDEQDYDTLFDIVQAIIEENDFKAMIDRAKNTFFTARSKWGGLKALKGSQA